MEEMTMARRPLAAAAVAVAVDSNSSVHVRGFVLLSMVFEIS